VRSLVKIIPARLPGTSGAGGPGRFGNAVKRRPGGRPATCGQQGKNSPESIPGSTMQTVLFG
jgi:hypothetical protein